MRIGNGRGSDFPDILADLDGSICILILGDVEVGVCRLSAGFLLDGGLVLLRFCLLRSSPAEDNESVAER